MMHYQEEKNELTMQLQQAQQSDSNPRGFRAPWCLLSILGYVNLA